MGMYTVSFWLEHAKQRFCQNNKNKSCQTMQTPLLCHTPLEGIRAAAMHQLSCPREDQALQEYDSWSTAVHSITGTGTKSHNLVDA
jgi:hypothetical protein